MRDREPIEDSAAGNRPLPPAAVEEPTTDRAGRHPRASASHRSCNPCDAEPTTGNPFLGESEVPALIVDDDHRIRVANRQCAALFGGEPLLGRRCYEVFHHRQAACKSAAWRCPLRHYRESGEPCRVVHVHHLRRGNEHHEVSVLPGVGAGLGACLELRPIAVVSARPCPCRLVGRSPAFNQMVELLLRAAPRDTPVLLLGEPGTCRETVARALHRLGGKEAEAFFAIRCAGLRKDAFATQLSAQVVRSSIAARDGNGSTLYLDDVGELGTGEQGKLLARLKAASRKCETAGTRCPRLVSAARPDLRARVAQGEFLDDLYYRVSVFPIPLPALRERREDLPLLADCILRQIGCASPTELALRTLEVLDRYPFPGNLRELRRILEHASLKASSRQIQPDDLPVECRVHAIRSS